jgi:nicotinamidase-related amidase
VQKADNRLYEKTMAHTAFLVIDFINDIAHLQGKIARSAERIAKNGVIANANKLIAHARKQKALLIFVRVGFSPGYPECPKHSPLFGGAFTHGALQLGTWGTEWHEDLDVQPQDITIVKHRVSCFYATPLPALLGAQQIHTLILSGTATNMAIEHTARDAHDRDLRVFVASDACESATEESHIAALQSMQRFCSVMDTKSVIEGVK